MAGALVGKELWIHDNTLVSVELKAVDYYRHMYPLGRGGGGGPPIYKI